MPEKKLRRASTWLPYDHPVDRYCGNQMCCWGTAGKKVPRRFVAAHDPNVIVLRREKGRKRK